MIITLKEHLKSNTKNSKDEEEGEDMGLEEGLINILNSKNIFKYNLHIEDENVIPLSQGNIDLLPFFTSQQFSTKISVVLYPLWADESTKAINSTVTDWEIYTLVPLIKNTNFCNVVYITMESIYNLPDDLIQEYENLVVNISLQSITKNENNKHDTVILCQYKYFQKSTIEDQNLNFIWESCKNNFVDYSSFAGFQTGCKLNSPRLLKNLVLPENNTLTFDEEYINHIIVSNSTHRFILSKELSEALHFLLCSNQQRILVEIFSNKNPSKILLRGYLDLSIFMYPKGISYISY